ncbi:D-alanyl-D-alanine carboxypeptidase family protein [Clostridium sp. UBA4548]|uniref:D-alanyl-D-alanine carboxypeptidase family protein n=1 Tax=Clostridium sp. UBA4548 TaxID=1946361 RepID=UPI0025BB9B22|nr:D-alanyl-D-alanine carboxypeptidase family protein [Clostridium sp. UBA4548]
MKKILLSLTLAVSIMTLNISNAFAASQAPSANANGVVVMDAVTGAVIYGNNEDTKYPPASPTKLMTVLLTLEKCKLDEKVKVGTIPPTIEGSKIYIDTNEEMTVKEMLYAVIMVSANDCAEALAEHISGSEEEFAKLMTQRAKELGCKNSTFKNPHGLYDDEHRTTAYDLATIEKELLKHPEYLEISKTKTYMLPATNVYPEQRPLWNDNRLLHNYEKYYYEYAIAGKTGYTDESRHSFVASATKNNNTFIIAMLYDPVKTYFADSKNYFEWAFDNFQTTKLFSKGQEVTKYTSSNGTVIPLLAGEDIYYTKELSLSSEPEFKFDANTLKDKFFLKGQPIAQGNVTYNNQSYTVPLVSGVDYEKKVLPVVGDLLTTETNTINYTYLGLLILVTIIFFLLLFFALVRNIKKKNSSKPRRNTYKK